MKLSFTIEFEVPDPIKTDGNVLLLDNTSRYDDIGLPAFCTFTGRPTDKCECYEWSPEHRNNPEYFVQYVTENRKAADSIFTFAASVVEARRQAEADRDAEDAADEAAYRRDIVVFNDIVADEAAYRRDVAVESHEGTYEDQQTAKAQTAWEEYLAETGYTENDGS